MTITVTAEHVEPFTKWRRGVAFADGTTDVALGLIFRASCGCEVAYGIRLDKPTYDERAMLNRPCPEHRFRWGDVLELLAENREADTADAIAEALAATLTGASS